MKPFRISILGLYCILLGMLLTGCHQPTPNPTAIGSDTNRQTTDTMWKQEFEQLLPKLGHRNWILVVDQAYPLQSAQGIITIDTEQPLPAVLKELVNMLNQAPHVKPIYYTDLELQALSDEICPRAEQARLDIFNELNGAQVNTILHEEVFAKIDAASKLFTTVVLKTQSRIPYSSVFIELDCGYWTSDAEEALRAKMKTM